jgi:hypothetical protein
VKFKTFSFYEINLELLILKFPNTEIDACALGSIFKHT